MKAITKRQQRVLSFIKFHVEQMGYPPSNEEIREHFGFASPNAAHCYIKALVNKGALIKQDNKARGLTIINTVAT